MISSWQWQIILTGRDDFGPKYLVLVPGPRYKKTTNKNEVRTLREQGEQTTTKPAIDRRPVPKNNEMQVCVPTKPHLAQRPKLDNFLMKE